MRALPTLLLGLLLAAAAPASPPADLLVTFEGVHPDQVFETCLKFGKEIVGVEAYGSRQVLAHLRVSEPQVAALAAMLEDLEGVVAVEIELPGEELALTRRADVLVHFSGVSMEEAEGFCLEQDAELVSLEAYGPQLLAHLRVLASQAETLVAALEDGPGVGSVEVELPEEAAAAPVELMVTFTRLSPDQALEYCVDLGAEVVSVEAYGPQVLAHLRVPAGEARRLTELLEADDEVVAAVEQEQPEAL